MYGLPVYVWSPSVCMAFHSVLAKKERSEISLYELHRLLLFSMILASFHMCDMVLVLRANGYSCLRETSSRVLRCLRCRVYECVYLLVCSYCMLLILCCWIVDWMCLIYVLIGVVAVLLLNVIVLCFGQAFCCFQSVCVVYLGSHCLDVPTCLDVLSRCLFCVYFWCVYCLWSLEWHISRCKWCQQFLLQQWSSIQNCMISIITITHRKKVIYFLTILKLSLKSYRNIYILHV